MTISAQDRESLAAKYELDDDAQLAAEAATRAAMDALVSRGYKASFAPDESGALEAAVVRYFLASQRGA